jgi:DnaK suppressor protein
MRDSKRAPSPAIHLTPAELDELRRRLVAERRRLIELYEEEVEAAQEIEVEGNTDLMDQAESGYERENHFSASDIDRELLRQIEEALERIDEGTYGICEHSGEPIPKARLEAVPWARYTAEVQQGIEEGVIRT